jgi:chitodextrinase
MTKMKHIAMCVGVLLAACGGGGGGGDTPPAGGGGDTTPPSVPTAFSATAALPTRIDLAWNASTDNVGVTEYELLRCAGAGCTPSTVLAAATATTFSDTGVSANTAYTYRVQARDAAGNVSGAAAASATTPAAADTTAPSQPANLTASAQSSSQIALAWTASTDNVGVAGYRIERCQGAACTNFAEVATTTSPSYNDSSLSAATAYSYRVIARDAAGNASTPSAAASATTQAPPSDTTPPSAPANPGASANSSSQITLSWTASTDNVGVAGYQVQRCQGTGCSNFADLGAPVTATTYVDAGLAPSTAYSYRVIARDAAGNASTPSAVASATTQAASGGANAVVAGAVMTPFPTLNNITVEWAVSGDANRNSEVAVRYRAQGTTAWSQGMALRRVPAGSNEGFSWSDRHSGSVFDVQSATAYEIELALTDPDGGSETRSVSVSTRSVPAPMTGAPVKPATPSTLASVLAAAQAGDIVELAAGAYSGFTIDKSGSASRPLVIRGTAGAVVNGEIGVFNQSFVHITGLTVNGRIRFNGSNDVAIMRNTVNGSSSLGGDGIVSYLRAQNSYIADNVVSGLTAWAESSLGVNGNNLGEGILVNGPGHVIMNNRVRGMRDGISFMEDTESVDQYSIDVLNNDVSEAGDDGIEADFCRHNCRIMRNRITNVFIALSSQPSLGGPTYFVRNVVYNAAHLAFKQYRGSIGDVLLHNTVVKSGDGLADYAGRPISNAYLRNNLFIGGPGGTYNGYSSGSGSVIAAPDYMMSTTSADYDAFGSSSGFSGRLGDSSFSSLTTLRANTTEKNAVQAALDAFAATIALPSAAMTAYPVPDLRPRAASVLENAGTPIANVNDGFTGSAPDIGAYEVGQALPVYGPR